MSPTSTEQNEVKPKATEPAETENGNSEENGRGLFQRNPRAKYLLFVALLVVLVAVGWYWFDSRRWESTDDAQIDGHIYPISARVGGQVVKVNVDDGTFVHKGDVLVQIDPKDYQVALDRAQADYQDSLANVQAAQANVPIADVGSASQIHSASADVTAAQASVAAAKDQMAAAKAQVIEAEANAKKLNNDVDRYKLLLDKKEIAQQQFDQAIAAATAANATVDARKASLVAAQEQVQVAESRVDQAKAGWNNALLSASRCSTACRSWSRTTRTTRCRRRRLRATIPTCTSSPAATPITSTRSLPERSWSY